MRLLKRALIGLVVLLLIAVVGAYWWQRPLLLTATGYAAHNACAVRFLAHRSDPANDLPSNPLVPYLREEPNESEGSVVGGLPLGLAKQQAWFTPGFGCTLAEERPQLPTPDKVAGSRNPFNASDAVVTPTPADQRAIDEAFAVQGTRAVLVARNGRLVAEQYADGFGPGTTQLGWSMTKSVTNLLVGRLVEEGLVSLSDDHLLPKWTGERAAITIDQLLRMTSGLKWDETYNLGTPITRMLYLEPDMADFLESLPLEHPPGTFQEYSSGSTTLLSAVLAQRSGYGPLVFQKMLFEPLGLASAVVEPDAVGTPVASSYGWMTPRDWLAIGEFALTGGEWNGKQLLPPNWMKESTTIQPVASSDDPNMAASWRSNTTPDGNLLYPDLPADTFWAQGHDGQWMYIVPSEKLVVLRLGFSPNIDDELVDELTAALIRAH